ncbi:MAG: SGNH/GDSL hydrolase family protein [Verrucomicrobiales bacterium]
MKETPLSRRRLIASGAAAAAVSFVRPRSAEAADAPAELDEGTVVLFQGDSITDARRDRKAQDEANDPAMLGRGYPFHIAGDLLAEHPGLGLQFYNRGISGNKVPDLHDRWQEDCLDLEPDILSILIGVNDLWHKLEGRSEGTAQDYRDGYAALLDRTRQALPDVTLVICEPFVTRCGAVNDSWFPEFETRRAFAEEVAKEAGAVWVPFQRKFDEAIAAGTEPDYWAADGVHPTHAGHALMAKTWRAATGV